MAPTLSMPLFVSPADVILRMQLSSELTGIDDVVSSGIIGAQLHIQRIISGKLERQSQDCVFFLDSEAFSGLQPGGVFRLEIPSGFIRRDTPVVVASSGVATTDSEVGPFAEFTAIDAGASKVLYEQGYVLVSPLYKDCYIRVQCDTGFEPGTNYDTSSPPALIPMEQIPVELYEAVMSLVPVVFNSGQTTNRSAEAESQYKTLSDHAALLLQGFMRTKGFTFRPIWS